jgi:hypothetical protein
MKMRITIGGCHPFTHQEDIGNWENIAKSVNSTHYSITETEINRLCIEKCGGEQYYISWSCPCNYCKCECK